jgi:hypothetical protein
MSVTADDLVTPDKKPASNSIQYNNNNTQSNTNTASTITKKKPFLKSQFVDHKTKVVSNVASAAIAQQPSGMTRTQQKLLLQREQSLIHDENNIAHPKNMIRLTREMEKMGKEYRCVRKYQDPMMDSLIRCQELQEKKTKKPVLQQRTFSSVVIPTTTSTNNTIPHMEQRRQILLKAAAQQQRNNQEDQDTQRWSAGQFIERLFYGTS